MTLVDEQGRASIVTPHEPVALIEEVRQRTRHRRWVSAIAVIVLAGIAGVSYAVVGGHSASPTSSPGVSAAGSAAGADGNVPMMLMSTVTLPGKEGPISGGGPGTVVQWYSPDFSIAVSAQYDVHGKLLGTTRRTEAVRTTFIAFSATTVYPQRHAWASTTRVDGCGVPCSFNAWTSLAPSSMRDQIARHELVVIDRTHDADGRPVLELDQPAITRVSESTYPRWWIDPANDEVEREEVSSGDIVLFHWVPATSANLAHLRLVVPSGYWRAPDEFATGVFSGNLPLSGPPTYRQAVTACALATPGYLPLLPIPHAPIPSPPPVAAVRSGVTDGIPWTFWVGTSQTGSGVYALMAGTGRDAHCLGDSPLSSDQISIAQLPGKAAVFVFGTVKDPSVTKVQATVFGTVAQVQIGRLPGTEVRYVFGDDTSVRCAGPYGGDLTYSTNVLAGDDTVGGTSASSGFGPSGVGCAAGW